MPDKSIVINTSPLLALIAAWGNLERLRGLYQQVLVPFEVCIVSTWRNYQIWS